MQSQTRRQQLPSPRPQSIQLVHKDVLQYDVQKMASMIMYHLHSIWLFTYSDLKTIMGPSTAFAVLNYLGCTAFGIERPQRTVLEQTSRFCQMIVWLWITLLPFNIDHQRQSIDEDLENKPWRPLPSGRMTPEQATVIMLVVYPIGLLFSAFVGAFTQSLALIGLGFWYNDLKGADRSWIIRNFINACGIPCFATGALQIILGNPPTAATDETAVSSYLGAHGIFTNAMLRTWLVMIGSIILSTIQVQDMHDQSGDKRHGRRSMPLVLGDNLTRWTIAIGTLFWSWSCPRFWSLPAIGFVSPIFLGSVIAWRTLLYKNVTSDKLTFRIWNLWLAMIYGLPWAWTWWVSRV